MSTATIQASEFSRLLVRAAKMLDRTGARTPEAIRKVVASSMQADIGQLPAKNRRDSHSRSRCSHRASMMR
ncbi:hypothetical protein QFZ94_008910 [Paraburkholderia sp. JPY465]|uniref:hypothetical protein n=1 Tax=Paraburkholderia sp. JPY465 TaxID=3042285 RepID=UPI003D1AD45C